MYFEFKNLKLPTEYAVKSAGAEGSSAATFTSFSETRIYVYKLLRAFNVVRHNGIVFLVFLERQLKSSKVPEHPWVSHLLSVVKFDLKFRRL